MEQRKEKGKEREVGKKMKDREVAEVVGPKEPKAILQALLAPSA